MRAAAGDQENGEKPRMRACRRCWLERGRLHNKSTMHTNTSPRKDIARKDNNANQSPEAENGHETRARGTENLEPKYESSSSNPYPSVMLNPAKIKIKH